MATIRVLPSLLMAMTLNFLAMSGGIIFTTSGFSSMSPSLRPPMFNCLPTKVDSSSSSVMAPILMSTSPSFSLVSLCRSKAWASWSCDILPALTSISPSSRDMALPDKLEARWKLDRRSGAVSPYDFSPDCFLRIFRSGRPKSSAGVEPASSEPIRLHDCSEKMSSSLLSREAENSEPWSVLPSGLAVGSSGWAKDNILSRSSEASLA